MMKSQEKRKKADGLILQWDNKALSASNARKGMPPDYNKRRSLVEYFDFLDEIMPHIQELRRTTVFYKPFRLV